MNLSLQEACIFHLYNVKPGEMVRFTNHWDLPAAQEYHQSMACGNSQEQAAAKALTIIQVFDVLQEFLSRPPQGADEDVMGAYTMDAAMYGRLFFYLREERKVCL